MPRDIRALEEEAEVAKKPEYLHECQGVGQDVSRLYVSLHHNASVTRPLIMHIECQTRDAGTAEEYPALSVGYN